MRSFFGANAGLIYSMIRIVQLDCGDKKVEILLG
jgi:hypothetical protein